MLQFSLSKSVRGRRALISGMLLAAIVSAGSGLNAGAMEASRELELKTGAQMIHEKHYTEGYNHFKKLADNGCPYSQCVVGLMHKNGVGVKKDPKAAFAYFERSAQQGFADAQRWLALMYLRGEGTPANRAKAMEWFEKAARNDVVEAQYKIGHLYRTSGMAASKEKSAEWLAKAGKNSLNAYKSNVAKLPQIPDNGYSGSSNSYTNGVKNIAQSWGGYSALAQNLQATQQ